MSLVDVKEFVFANKLNFLCGDLGDWFGVAFLETGDIFEGVSTRIGCSYLVYLHYIV